VNLDVTGLVGKWAKGTLSNNGMLLRAGSETQTSTLWRFYGGSYPFLP